MQKEILLDILEQNRLTCSFAFDQLTVENSCFRLNGETASAGFIYRHVGETMNMFGLFFGMKTDAENTTMGAADDGREFDLEESRELIGRGFAMLREVAENTSAEAWLEDIDTPFFGRVSRVRLFSHVLFHNAHHAGQIALTLAKGENGG